MFEEHKLNKYANCFVGFAYDYFDPIFANYGTRFYIVIDNGQQYEFIKYRKCKDDYGSNIKKLNAQPVKYWMDLNKKRIQEQQGFQKTL